MQRVLNGQQRLLGGGLLLAQPAIAAQEQPNIQLLERLAQREVFLGRLRLLFERCKVRFQLL